LGDSVLNCAVAHLLYQQFPDLPEGALSRLRASLVRQQALFEIAMRLEIGAHLRLGDGEVKSGGRQRPSILADALESLFGALFLDAGFDTAARVIQALYAAQVASIDPNQSAKDAKTLLQEVLQSRRLALPDYVLVGTRGEAHAQTFHIDCVIAALNIRTHGAGNSRRVAEQNAAQQAYNVLNG
jgi:ribonuclease-3